MIAMDKELTKMCIVKFNANGNSKSISQDEELDSLLDHTEGVVDWAVGKHGEVTIEFDPDLVTSESIRLDLSEMGLVFENIYDDDPMLADQSVIMFLNE
jgi:coproporphyrinogen III oxidase-like Fe-S oxidoreductase